MLLKLGLGRIAVERRSIHVENQKIICEVHSATFLLRDRGLLKRFVVAGQMQNLAAAKSTVPLQNIRLNTRVSCTIVSVELLLIWYTNYDGNSSTFVDMWNVNTVGVCGYTLLGLTASKKQLHCWQSMFVTTFVDGSQWRQLSLLTVDVEDLPFDVSSRCRRLRFHCWQSMSKTYLSMSTVGVFFNVET